MRELKLSNTNKCVLVDDEDYDRLNKYTWSQSNMKQVRRTYNTPQKNYNRKTYSIAIANDVLQNYKCMYDHIDRNPFNNQKCNLRPVTFSQNMMNRTKSAGCISSYKGVSKSNRCKPWKAHIKYKKVTHYLGLFDYEIAAAFAYDRHARQLFGEYACLNFPQITKGFICTC